MTLVAKNEKAPATPNVPAWRPPRSLPWAWAQSSTSASPRCSHQAATASISGPIRPPVCTTVTAAVRGVHTARTCSRVGAKVVGSTPARRTVAPARSAAMYVAKLVAAGDDDFTALHTQGSEDQLQGGGAAGDGKGARRPRVRRELLLERLDIAPLGEPAGPQQPVDLGEHLVTLVVGDLDLDGRDQRHAANPSRMHETSEKHRARNTCPCHVPGPG